MFDVEMIETWILQHLDCLLATAPHPPNPPLPKKEKNKKNSWSTKTHDSEKNKTKVRLSPR